MLYWNIPLLGENRVFALSREVLRITNGLRDWNFALYGTAWNTVLAGLAYLVAENSNYAPSMVRQIDAQEPLAEALIANRLFYMLLKAVMATQRADTPSNRLLIQDVYAKAQVLHIPELEQKMQRLSTRALALDLNTPAK